MNRTIIYVLLGMIMSSVLQAQIKILPRYLTEQERSYLPYYTPPHFPGEITDPPPYTVRTMAEWEELQGIMITWTSFPFILSQIVDYAQEECIVYIVCSDSNTVRTYLTNNGVPLYNIQFIITNFNSIWIRDYGPWTAYTETTDTLNIIDWIYNRPRPYDDLIPGIFANLINAPHFSTTTPPYNLTHSGGNFMTDGYGTGFSSKLVLQENPAKTEAEIDTIMKKYMGIHRYVKMNVLPYDVIHHIDMHMKLLDEETLLVGEYPLGVSDGPQIEANLQYILNNFKNCYGRDFKVVRIPMPPDQFGRYPSNGGDYRTYTNSMIVNKTVIIPTYEYQYDTTAFRIYREAMPGYNIVGIESNSIVPLLGTIHCIVKEVGAYQPVRISHASLENQADNLQSYPVIAHIKTSSGIQQAELFWTIDTTMGFNPVPMTNSGLDSFYAEIPAQTTGSMVYYYISAESNLGKTRTKPLTAPLGYYKFNVLPATSIHPSQAQEVSKIVVYPNYPNPFNPITHIKFYLPVTTQLQVTIYNALGEKITTLHRGVLNAGFHQLQWDAQETGSGVYFYEISTGGFRKIKKIMLVK
ncbi:MAG: agmatine deiminase family protein [bacterium]|nr:MAG: agmatine deiminase family protein [bacterium]